MKEQRPDIFISEGVEKTLSALQKVYKPDDIRMAALYGSAVKGNFVCGISDINLFIVITHSAVAEFDQSTIPISKMLQHYRVQTKIVSERALERSVNIFPVEYLEIRDTMNLLFGEDVLSLLKIDRSLYHHQVEERLYDSITALRHLALIIQGRRKVVQEFYVRWCGKQDTLFRAMIRLKDERKLAEVGFEAGSHTAEMFGELYGVPVEPLVGIYTFRDDPDIRLVGRDTIRELLRIYTALEKHVESMTGL